MIFLNYVICESMCKSLLANGEEKQREETNMSEDVTTFGRCMKSATCIEPERGGLCAKPSF